MKLFVLNGPNLNMLGTREVSIYGTQTYKDLVKYLKAIAREKKIKIKVLQTNYEGDYIDAIQKAHRKQVDGLVLNAGAWTHTSYAILDAIKSGTVPCVEVHLSDINAREPFRQVSVIRDGCVASFSGRHFESYKDAIEYIIGVKNV